MVDLRDLSIYTGRKGIFGTVDYVLFSLMFVASAAIGFYHAWRDRNKKNASDFHLGGRKMHPVPVSLSLSATFLSSMTLLGIPAEIYTNGTIFFWIVVAMLIATTGAAHVFVPVFYNLNITSCFQYFEMRFGTVARVLASILFFIQTLVYMGFVLYAPSLALEAVTGISLWGCMIGTAAVCTLYTSLGGMKTVLWTDSLQFTIMIAGLVAVVAEGSRYAGGFANAWDIAASKGRIEFLDFSPDPRTRHSVWTVAIGGSFFWLYLYGVNQAQVQRACSLSSLTKAKLALWLNFPGLVVIVLLTCMCGVVMFAVYSDCHPVKVKLVERNDQLLPLFVLDTLGKIPGLSGIFVACIFSGGLSTFSSALNALSAILLEDYIKPLSKHCCNNTIKNHGILISKVLVIILGIAQFGFAVLVSKFKGLILQFSYSMYSITAGPIFGMFVAGMFFPWTNQVGAVSGFILSLAFMCWLGVGSLLEKPMGMTAPLSFSTAGCFNSSMSVSNTTTLQPVTAVAATTATVALSSAATLVTTTAEPILHNFYRMSYQWYTGLGMIIATFLAVVISFMTGYTRAKNVDPRLMCPIFDVIFPWLPESVRKPLRFGVRYDRREEYEATDKKKCAIDEKGVDNRGADIVSVRL